jgi:hypothetical protein
MASWEIHLNAFIYLSLPKFNHQKLIPLTLKDKKTCKKTTKWIFLPTKIAKVHYLLPRDPSSIYQSGCIVPNFSPQH